MNLLDRVKELCLENGISQRKLESKLELSNGATSKWGKSSPSADVLQKVSDFFNVSTDYLLGKVPFKNETEAHYSINIAAVKYLLNHKEEIPYYFALGTGLYNMSDNDFDSDIIAYSETLLNKFDKNLSLTDLELYELSHIMFSEVKGHDYTGVIILKNFEDDSFSIRLDLNEINKVNKLNLDKSFFFKSHNTTDDSVFKYNSVLSELVDSKSKNNNEITEDEHINTIAAHHDGENFTEEELEEIQRFKEFVKSRRNN